MLGIQKKEVQRLAGQTGGQSCDIELQNALDVKCVTPSAAIFMFFLFPEEDILKRNYHTRPNDHTVRLEFHLFVTNLE